MEEAASPDFQGSAMVKSITGNMRMDLGDLD